MVKSHRVPDWLNSSLWSTATLPDADPHSSTSKYSTPIEPIDSETASSIRTPIGSPPPPPPYPSTTLQSSPPSPVVIEETRGKEDESELSRSREVEEGILSAEELARQSMLVTELLKKVINLKELRRLAAQGLTDAAGIRSSAWKLLLGYLPSDRAKWPSELAKKRSQYKHFKDELLMNPSEIARRMERSSFSDDDGTNYDITGSLSRLHVTHGEHPPSLGKSSVWNQFFQDTEIIEQIDRDVKRTHPDMEFFSVDTTLARNNNQALRRILIIFAKLNPGIRYVQGMNEILAPIYYVFKNS